MIMEIDNFEDKVAKEYCVHSDLVDPSEVKQLSERYNISALGPMLAWVQKRKASSEMVQYREVIDELNKFSPKYCCEMVFSRNILLPELEKNGTLPDLPESMVAVLYTLHLVHSEGTRLIDVKMESNDLIFEAEFDSRIGGKIVTDACKYKLCHYLSPAECRLSVKK
jgi:hypothetical protein